MSLPLSRLRSCLLLGLQLEPPVATQPGRAAITPAAALADSFGVRGTLGEEEVSWNCLMWPGTTSAGGCDISPQPAPSPCQGVVVAAQGALAGPLSVLGMPPHLLPCASLQGTRSVSRRTES